MRLIDADVLLEKVREIRKLALDRAVETPANMPFPIYQNPAYTRYSTQADEREKFKVMIEEAPSIQPEQKKGTWTKDASCPFCGFKPWYERDIHTLSFCPNCGADNRGKTE